MDLASMGEKIKIARMGNGLTLEKLSEKLDISRNFLWEIEAGRKAPAINTLYKISVELNISIDYLFSLSNESRHLNNDMENKKYKVYDIVDRLSGQETDMLLKLLKTYKGF